MSGSKNVIQNFVYLYYIFQEQRKRIDLQNLQLEKAGGKRDPYLDKASEVFRKEEEDVKKQMVKWCKTDHMASWALDVVGIGPVIAAGLSAHIDITRAPTVGHIWAFAGLDPSKVWRPKTKRPWCAQLKTLCFHAGESFVKLHKHEGCVYGQLWAERKVLEQDRNERGEFAEQAEAILKAKKFKKTTEAYKHYSAGRLPPAHVHARARRWTVKQFLSDWHGEAYRHEFGKEPPLPYPIAILGHVHLRSAPEHNGKVKKSKREALV